MCKLLHCVTSQCQLVLLLNLSAAMKQIIRWQQFTTRNSPGDEIAKRDFLHILASPGYAPGTIAVNGWKEDSCWSKHGSMYPSIFNRLRAIARYWSEIATFSYPLHLTPPLGRPLDDLRDFWWASYRMASIQYGAKISPKS